MINLITPAEHLAYRVCCLSVPSFQYDWFEHRCMFNFIITAEHLALCVCHWAGDYRDQGYSSFLMWTRTPGLETQDSVNCFSIHWGPCFNLVAVAMKRVLRDGFLIHFNCFDCSFCKVEF